MFNSIHSLGMCFNSLSKTSSEDAEIVRHARHWMQSVWLLWWRTTFLHSLLVFQLAGS